MTTPQTIGVIGAGTMGNGIAQVVAVKPTNEEWIAASHAVRVLSANTSLAAQP